MSRRLELYRGEEVDAIVRVALILQTARDCHPDDDALAGLAREAFDVCAETLAEPDDPPPDA